MTTSSHFHFYSHSLFPQHQHHHPRLAPITFLASGKRLNVFTSLLLFPFNLFTLPIPFSLVTVNCNSTIIPSTQNPFMAFCLKPGQVCCLNSFFYFFLCIFPCTPQESVKSFPLFCQGARLILWDSPYSFWSTEPSVDTALPVPSFTPLTSSSVLHLLPGIAPTISHRKYNHFPSLQIEVPRSHGPSFGSPLSSQNTELLLLHNLVANTKYILNL